MNLDNYSDEELKANLTLLKKEIERREKEASAIPVAKNPIDINWMPLLKYTSTYIKSVSENNITQDGKQYIFEMVMEAIYGGNIWNWWNKNTYNS